MVQSWVPGSKPATGTFKSGAVEAGMAKMMSSVPGLVSASAARIAARSVERAQIVYRRVSGVVDDVVCQQPPRFERSSRKGTQRRPRRPNFRSLRRRPCGNMRSFVCEIAGSAGPSPPRHVTRIKNPLGLITASLHTEYAAPLGPA